MDSLKHIRLGIQYSPFFEMIMLKEKTLQYNWIK